MFLKKEYLVPEIGTNINVRCITSLWKFSQVKEQKEKSLNMY